MYQILYMFCLSLRVIICGILIQLMSERKFEDTFFVSLAACQSDHIHRGDDVNHRIFDLLLLGSEILVHASVVTIGSDSFMEYSNLLIQGFIMFYTSYVGVDLFLLIPGFSSQKPQILKKPREELWQTCYPSQGDISLREFRI